MESYDRMVPFQIDLESKEIEITRLLEIFAHVLAFPFNSKTYVFT